MLPTLPRIVQCGQRFFQKYVLDMYIRESLSNFGLQHYYHPSNVIFFSHIISGISLLHFHEKRSCRRKLFATDTNYMQGD